MNAISHQPKLIILRGNSGSGKSSVAKRLRELSEHKLAIVGQDVIRREILPAEQPDDTATTDLIEQTVSFALDRGYHVVLEGILKSKHYEAMLRRLAKRYPNHYAYYLDVSLEETLRRHETRQIGHEYTAKDMRSWYRPGDLLGLANEKIISEASSLGETANLIKEETKL